MQLQDFAQVVRSKNAGPRRFTLDLIFRNDPVYQRVAQSEVLTAEKIAPLYGVAAIRSKSFTIRSGGNQIVVPRLIMSGDPSDRDVYGAQQQAYSWTRNMTARSVSSNTSKRPAATNPFESLARPVNSDMECRRLPSTPDLIVSRT